MADQKQGDQPQGGQPKGGNPPADVRKVQEQTQKAVNRAQEYQTQLAERQKRYYEKYAEAYKSYSEKLGEAYNSYQDSVKGIHEGAKKAAAPQQSEGSSPEKDFEAFKAASAKKLHQANDVQHQLRSVERQYSQKCTSFWDDFSDIVSEAVTEFWDWIIGWWEEPPVEGGALRHLADPAWRASFDPASAAYFSGWNYGAKLY